jgi:hypothetical protein
LEKQIKIMRRQGRAITKKLSTLRIDNLTFRKDKEIMNKRNNLTREFDFRRLALLERFSRLLQLAIIAVSFVAPSISFGKCTAEAGFVQCDLLTVGQNGGQPMVVNVPAAQYLELLNSSGAAIQINRVYAVTNERLYWSEFCAYLNNGCTCQPSPGIGEVGCTFKDVGEDYPPLGWTGDKTALAVSAGSVLYLNSHTVPKLEPHTYIIYAYPQATGIISYRYPTADEIFTCNGTTQTTNWNPIRNTSGRLWYVGGATVYADGGGGVNARTMVNAACVYILDANGIVRWRYCGNGLNVRGYTTFPTQVVNTNEYLVLQASNRCDPDQGGWDYAGWLYVWY